MAIVDFPTTRAFQGSQFSLWVNTSERAFTGFFTGNRTTRSNSADRMGCQVVLPPVKNRTEAAEREAWLMSLRSTGNHVRFGMPHRPVPLGTIRGTPTADAAAIAGARIVALEGALSGANLFRMCEAYSGQLATGWTLSNATITENAAVAPDGTSTAWVLNRTAPGNHFASFTLPLASTAYRTVTFSVWIKAGTLTGTVRLRIRDGDGMVDVAVGTQSFTPTGTWQLFRVSGTFGGSSAANVICYIDPNENTGLAADTLLLWTSEIRVSTGFDTLCISRAEGETSPNNPAVNAHHVERLSASNAYTAFQYTTTSHANQTFTASCYLKSNTFSGNVTLRLQDGAASEIASSTLALSASWQRVTVTGTFGATPAANVLVVVDPADGGSVGEIYARYGVMLNTGATAGEYQPLPTAAAGDFIGSGGNLLQVANAATGDPAGRISLNLTTPLQRAIADGAAFTTVGPTGVWELDDLGLQVDYTAPIVQGPVVLRFRQVPQ